jgi:hypothetical protein
MGWGKKLIDWYARYCAIGGKDVKDFVIVPDGQVSDGFKCTYCGGEKFYEGPSGGMAVNIICTNPTCRHMFNDMGPFGVDDLNKVDELDNSWFITKVKEAADEPRSKA